MNKSIVYFLVLSSFIVGCGQGFEGNLAQVKDAAPFNESVDTQDSQQQTDTTRPLQDNLQPSSDEEGVGYIYNINPTVDGNFNNTVDTTNSAFYFDQFENNNPEIAVQGINWSESQKPGPQQNNMNDSDTDVNIPSAHYSVTNDTPSQPEAANDESQEVETKPAHYTLTQETPGKPKAINKINKSSDEEGKNVAWNTTSDSLIATVAVQENKRLQSKVLMESKCSTFDLFEKHKQNLDQYTETFDKLLTYLKVNDKYKVISKINCEVLNGNAGVIYNNFEKLNTMNIKVLAQGRPSVKPLKFLFADVVKTNIVKNNRDVNIILITNPNSKVNNISTQELAEFLKSAKNVPVLISTEESFNKWVDAVNILKGI